MPFAILEVNVLPASAAGNFASRPEHRGLCLATTTLYKCAMTEDQHRAKPFKRPFRPRAGGKPGATEFGKPDFRKPGFFRRERAKSGPASPDKLFVYGIHPVRHALENPRRRKFALHATRNGLVRLEAGDLLAGLQIVEASPHDLDRLLGSEAVHQGVALECAPLQSAPLSELAQSRLLLVLDQVTDPHNVGAVMRSAVAFGAGALITTARHSPAESGVLAKSASGALDMLPHVEVRNLGQCIEELQGLGFAAIGLDSEGGATLEATLDALPGQPSLALVLGAEGKGLREKTKSLCTHLARIDLPGAITSLNVSNAAALALYMARRRIERAI
jgi:23S rRNA (guanosine2251-2'-O)-methyltransferase